MKYESQQCNIFILEKIEERHGIKEILDKSDTNPKSKS